MIAKQDVTGPAERFFEVEVLKNCIERSERSVNRRGVQGPAVGPLVGWRGAKGAEPPEAQRFQTFECSLADSPILRPL